MEKRDEMTLANLGGAALEGMFQRRLAKLLLNIEDPNKPAQQERSITLRISFKPTKNRECAAVALSCSSKLAADESIETTAYIGRDKDRMVAREWNPRQRTIGEDTVPEEN